MPDDEHRTQEPPPRTMTDAIAMVAGDLDLESTLRRITEAAVGLVNARYGALGVFGAADDRNRLSSFVTVGVGERPERVGFAAGHPSMSGFLGVPIRVRDEVFGNLYLAEKRDAAEFDSDDEKVIKALAVVAGIAVENARMYEQATGRRRWLAASSQLQSELLGGASEASALGLAARHARELLGADTVFIVLPDAYEDGLLRAMAVDGEHGESLMGSTVVAPMMDGLIESGVAEVSAEFAGRLAEVTGREPGEFGSVLAVPIGISDTGEGALVALRGAGSPMFDSLKLPDVVSFAQDAALALRAAEGQRAQHLLDVLSDRERIAADLHDHVIQRLYGCGMNLQATLPRVTIPEVRRRILAVVEELDTTIREIRTSIFALQSRNDDGGSLRRRLLDASAQTAADSAVSPTVHLSGAVDTLVPDDIADHAEAVVREAVSNAVRHAEASRIVVSAEAGDMLVIEVTDDGNGIPENVIRSGLANLERRARQCGGRLSAVSGPHGGTRVTWQVPLP